MDHSLFPQLHHRYSPLQLISKHESGKHGRCLSQFALAIVSADAELTENLFRLWGALALASATMAHCSQNPPRSRGSVSGGMFTSEMCSAYVRTCGERQLPVLGVGRSERPNPDIDPTTRRSASVSPKRSLDQLCSILARSMSAMRTERQFAALARTAAMG